MLLDMLPIGSLEYSISMLGRSLESREGVVVLLSLMILQLGDNKPAEDG